MHSFRLSVRRAGALAALAFATLVSGCATYSDSYYVDDRYGGDYYYGRDDGYYADPYWGAYAYDSVLWPTYRWYDPWYAPGYYYGINYSPSWFGLSFGYFGRSHYYSPWAYHHYSPYRYSWWDNHATYGGTGWRHGYRDGYSAYRFGSARNEAERIARAEASRPRAEAPSAYRGDAAPRGGNWSRGIDYGDARGGGENDGAS
jgi:hypothetical protein